ncbi:MAG: hypothetical protein ABUK01_05625 [Leptospirales bacterium]
MVRYIFLLTVFLASQSVTGLEVCRKSCTHEHKQKVSVPDCHKSTSVNSENVLNTNCDSMSRCYLNGETEQNLLGAIENVEPQKPTNSILYATLMHLKDYFPSTQENTFLGAIRDGPSTGLWLRPVYLLKNSFII